MALYSSSRRFTRASEKFSIIAFIAKDRPTTIFEETITSQFPKRPYKALHWNCMEFCQTCSVKVLQICAWEAEILSWTQEKGKGFNLIFFPGRLLNPVL